MENMKTLVYTQAKFALQALKTKFSEQKCTTSVIMHRASWTYTANPAATGVPFSREPPV
jgi:hypothetical protein